MSEESPLTWSANALVALKALRRGTSQDGVLTAKAQVISLALETLPGESILGAALRRSSIWPEPSRVISDHRVGSNAYPAGSGKHPFAVELEAEAEARSEGVRNVGERHLMRALNIDDWPRYGVNIDKLKEFVRHAELGNFEKMSELGDRWHGLIDTSIVIQFHELRSIVWREVVSATKVLLWLPVSVLNELDYLSSQGESIRVKQKARDFTKWLMPQLDEALRTTGVTLQDDGRTRLRVLPSTESRGLRDTDHLEAALHLRDWGIPICVLTADSGLMARATVAGLPFLQPDDRWRLQPDPGPRDIETQLRLRRANLELPPQLSCDCRFEASVGFLDLVSSVDGGQARSVRILWQPVGGQQIVASDALNEYRTLVHLDQPNRYQQTLDGTMPPGGRILLSQFNYLTAPSHVIYEIWADGMNAIRGQTPVGGQPS